MLKIYIPNASKQPLGGGFTFVRNLVKGSIAKFNVVNNWVNCDIVLIAGVTITDRKEIEDAKRAGKKIVLRVDNMPKDSRNRGTAFSRMRDFGKLADWIVFQSEWAKDYVGWWLREKVESKCMFFGNNVSVVKKDEGVLCGNSVIYNGVDTDYFFSDEEHSKRLNNYLVVQYNRDENKRIQEAFYHFGTISRGNPEAKLNVVGKFSPDLVGYNFDFFNNENILYHGIIEDPKAMGEIMRQNKYFYFPSFADACSNACAEAVACGLEILLVNDCGGTKEVIAKHSNGIYSIQDMADDYLSIFNKLTK